MKNTNKKSYFQQIIPNPAGPTENPTENGSEENNKNTKGESQPDQIKNMGAVITTSGGRRIYCLTIIGQIEGHYVLPAQNKTTKYEHVIPQLVAIEEDKDVDGLLILLNTVGGDVEAGLAIAELIAGMSKPTVSMVLGGGHSIGVPLAVAAKKSFIVKSATMTVHPVRMGGTTIGVPQAFDYFRRMQKRITNFIVSNCSIAEKRLMQLSMNTEELVMDVGTILDGDKAVKEGIIDNIGGLSDALECLYDMIEKNKGEECPLKETEKKAAKGSRKKKYRE